MDAAAPRETGCPGGRRRRGVLAVAGILHGPPEPSTLPRPALRCLRQCDPTGRSRPSPWRHFRRPPAVARRPGSCASMRRPGRSASGVPVHPLPAGKCSRRQQSGAVHPDAIHSTLRSWSSITVRPMMNGHGAMRVQRVSNLGPTAPGTADPTATSPPPSHTASPVTPGVAREGGTAHPVVATLSPGLSPRAGVSVCMAIAHAEVTPSCSRGVGEPRRQTFEVVWTRRVAPLPASRTPEKGGA
jgi:hypothetical protein